MKFNYNSKSAVRNTLLSAILSLLLIVIYIELSHYWVSFGGLSGNLTAIELPALTLLIFLLLYPSERIVKNVWLTSVPIIGAYILYDVFYHFLARSPRVSDLTGISNLGDFSPVLSVSLYAVLLALVLLLLFSLYQFYLMYSKSVFFSVIGLKLIALLCTGYFINRESFQGYVENNFEYVPWSQSRTIHKNGRISSSLYYTASSIRAKERLKGYKQQVIGVNSILFEDKAIENKKGTSISLFWRVLSTLGSLKMLALASLPYLKTCMRTWKVKSSHILSHRSMAVVHLNRNLKYSQGQRL